MNSWVLIPWGSAFLRLTEAEFRAALGRGLASGPLAAPAQPPVAGEGLVDSMEMGRRLGVAAEWCEAKAKQGEIPSVMVGRYRRFDPLAVLSAVKNGHADRQTATRR